MNTIEAGIVGNFDLFAYYGSFSGSYDVESVIDALKSETYRNYEFKYYYLGVGGADDAFKQLKPFYERLLEGVPEKLTAENSCYLEKVDHGHTTMSIMVDLYNCLKFEFFKK